MQEEERKAVMASRRLFSGMEDQSENVLINISDGAFRLYHYLNTVFADDFGFIQSVKSALRLVGKTNDDLQELIDNNLVYQFDSGVCVLLNWQVNNSVSPSKTQAPSCPKELSYVYMENDCRYIVSDTPVRVIPNWDKDDAKTHITRKDMFKDSNRLSIPANVNKETGEIMEPRESVEDTKKEEAPKLASSTQSSSDSHTQDLDAGNQYMSNKYREKHPVPDDNSDRLPF